MLKGLDQIRDFLSSRGDVGEGVPELVIKSGEIALIHFLSEREDIVEARFHRVPETTPGGFVVTREKFCRAEIGEVCPLCSHQSEDVRSRTLRWYAWAHLYSLLVSTAPPGMSATEMQTVVRGRRTLYAWELNTPVILRKGEGQHKYLVNQLLTHDERFGTLCDRAYEWERTGATRNDTSYLLSPFTELAGKPDLGDIKLQSLEEIITSGVRLIQFPSRGEKRVEGAEPQVGNITSLMQLLHGQSEKPKL